MAFSADEEKKSLVKDIKLEGDNFVITLEMDAKQFVDRYINDRANFIGWEEKRHIEEQAAKLVVEKIWESEGKKIVEQVLKEVNWPDVVRSKIAQKVSANAGRENWE